MNMLVKNLSSTLDVLVVGAGPTGISCAIECKKNGLSCVLLEKGVLVNSLFHFPVNMTFFSTSLKLEIAEIPFISNNEKPTRAEALEYYRRLVDHYKLDVKYKQTVIAIESKGGIYKISTQNNSFNAKHIIIATGYYDLPRMLNVPGETLHKVKHYYDEAHHYINQDVVVIGGANSACDVALETWSKGAKVTMVVREPALYQNVKYWILPNVENRIKEGSITAYFNSQILEIKEESVIIQTTTETIEIPNDFVLAMTGYLPDYSFLNKIGIEIEDDENKTPVFNPETLESNRPNIYIAGVLNAGLATSKLFIENTRHHADLIIKNIIKRNITP
jgi:thioredoxin reductase (NADPH)